MTPDWDDLETFLDLDDFAVEVRLFPAAGEPRTVPAIFDRPFLSADLGEYMAETEQPRITATEADLQGMTRGDRVDVAGTVYDVLGGPQPDGTGMATLPLAPEPA